MMRSQGNGGQSATKKVKEWNPEIINIALGQGFNILEASILACVCGTVTALWAACKSHIVMLYRFHYFAK